MNESSPERFSLDRDPLLAALQTGFPIESRPFQAIGARFGLSEREVIDRILGYEEDGLIRAFGPVFDPGRLGYVSTLAAAQVESDRLPELATAMLTITEITHNYLREHTWNLWFTVTASNRDAIDTILKWVHKFPGVKQVMNLPASRVFKINAVWGLESGMAQPERPAGDAPPARIDHAGELLVRAFQQEFPILERPFRIIAGSIGAEETTVIDTVRGWMTEGTIRRFGARLNHRQVGYAHNLLTVWGGSDLETWGEKFARFDEVSHCYLRDTGPQWPYGLYAMVHARSEAELRRSLASLKRAAPGANLMQLKTLYELKKSTMKYFVEE